VYLFDTPGPFEYIAYCVLLVWSDSTLNEVALILLFTNLAIPSMSDKGLIKMA
jgi:hypothetical protein